MADSHVALAMFSHRYLLGNCQSAGFSSGRSFSPSKAVRGLLNLIQDLYRRCGSETPHGGVLGGARGKGSGGSPAGSFFSNFISIRAYVFCVFYVPWRVLLVLRVLRDLRDLRHGETSQNGVFLTPLRTQISNLLAVVPEKGFFF